MLQRGKKPEDAKQKGVTPMEAALKYLNPKARTVREVERYLDEQQFGEYEIMQVIDRLLELNYLNDKSYAEEFVRSRLATKPVSKMKLRMQMEAHELPADVITAALSTVSDADEQVHVRKVAEKFYRQLASLPEDELRERLLRRLISRGYSFDDANAAVRNLLEGNA